MTQALAEVAKQAGLVRAAGSPALGIEGMDDKDLKIGTVVLVQPLTKALTKKGIAPGKFANTVTESEVTDTTFIPAYMTKVFQVVKWEGDKAVFLGTVNSETDPLLSGKRWRNEKLEDGRVLKAEVVPTIKVIAIMSGQPVAINFKKMSAYPAGQKLYTFARDAARTSGLPLWGQKYRLVSKDAKNKGGIEYLAMDVEVVGPTTDEEKNLAVSLYTGFKSSPEPVLDAAEPVEEAPF
jgi:hypothetical protein